MSQQQKTVRERENIMANKSIYESVLGSTFSNLHPMLQKRYSVKNGRQLKATGIMYQIKGGPKWLYPVWLLGTMCKLVFPEHGEHIPFTITNQAYTTSEGVEEVHWERKFHFPKATRFFNAVMSYDKKRNMIKDYLGEPSPLYSDLQLIVEADRSLTIQSVNQRLVLGPIEIPLPTFLHGIATVKESYHDAEEQFHISVHVRNPLIGTVFAYEGVFTIDE